MSNSQEVSISQITQANDKNRKIPQIIRDESKENREQTDTRVFSYTKYFNFSKSKKNSTTELENTNKNVKDIIIPKKRAAVTETQPRNKQKSKRMLTKKTKTEVHEVIENGHIIYPTFQSFDIKINVQQRKRRSRRKSKKVSMEAFASPEIIKKYKIIDFVTKNGMQNDKQMHKIEFSRSSKKDSLQRQQQAKDLKQKVDRVLHRFVNHRPKSRIIGWENHHSESISHQENELTNFVEKRVDRSVEYSVYSNHEERVANAKKLRKLVALSKMSLKRKD